MSWLSGMMGGGGGGGDYEAYMAEREKRMEEERARSQAEQAAIDGLQDPLERKKANRRRYKCGEDRYVTVDDIPQWSTVAPTLAANPKHTTAGGGGGGLGRGSFMTMNQDTVEFTEVDLMRQKDVDPVLNGKISIWQGDICRLEVDAIVNAANSSLMGGGGIDGAIHGAAGNMLGAECETLNGAETGETKITRGYRLPAAHVLHTVGPIGGGDAELESCYQTSLNLMLAHNLRTAAFCCVSTGIFGFPLVRATHIALKVIRNFLEVHSDKVDRIIFCVFRDIEVESYEKVVPSYFPIAGYPEKELPAGTIVLSPEVQKRRWGGGSSGMMGGATDVAEGRGDQDPPSS